MACPNPLTPAQCEVLTAVLQHIHDTDELIAKAMRCSIPMEDEQQRQVAQRKLAADIKREFFPSEH
jgi:hypothetical protein